MKRSQIYLLVTVVFIAVIAVVIFRFKNKEAKDADTEYALLPRKGVIATLEEWKNTKIKASALLQKLKTNPQDKPSLAVLAAIYIQEARITGNYAYYDMAAMKYVNDILKKDPADFEALMFKSLIYLSQHHFAEGLATGEKAKTINPYNSYIYGILVDGNVEMGNYDSAVQNADKMAGIRPDMRSYSRISYLREIYGDYPGAIEAMQMAVEAGVPGQEATEWSRVQLGHLYENTGNLDSAKINYDYAVTYRPGYAYALAGLARIAVANKNYDQAINYYLQADSSVTDFSIREGLAEVYHLSGQKDKALTLDKEVINGMTGEAQKGNANENIGHYVDRELAYTYLKINEYDKALEHALLEYNRRPANIDVNEAVAWVYYSKGDYQKALPYIKTALKTNSKNPTLLCRAALIFAKNGETALAKTNLQNVLHTNANISKSLRVESTNVLASL